MNFGLYILLLLLDDDRFEDYCSLSTRRTDIVGATREQCNGSSLSQTSICKVIELVHTETKLELLHGFKQYNINIVLFSCCNLPYWQTQTHVRMTGGFYIFNIGSICDISLSIKYSSNHRPFY